MGASPVSLSFRKLFFVDSIVAALFNATHAVSSFAQEVKANLSDNIPYLTAASKAATVIVICSFIIIGGLYVFHRRSNRDRDTWGQLSVQTLGTIFFFPTLVILGVYLDLDKSAVTTILGAFIGYLFSRGASPSPEPDKSAAAKPTDGSPS